MLSILKICHLVKRYKVIGTGKKMLVFKKIHLVTCIFSLYSISCILNTNLNSLPNNKILDWSKLIAFADKILDVVQMMFCVTDWVENIVGKGENAGNQHFLLFLQCFQKVSFPGSVKVRIVW